MKKLFTKFFVGQELSNTINLNQFSQTRIKGDLDLTIMRSGVITAAISENQATAIVPGQRVKLDTVAGVPMPQVLAAGINDVAIGVLKRSVNKSSFVAGDACEIVYCGAPVMVEEAGGVIAAGASVEQLVSTTKVVTFGTSTAKKHGIAIDAAAASGDLIRVIVLDPINVLS